MAPKHNTGGAGTQERAPCPCAGACGAATGGRGSSTARGPCAPRHRARSTRIGFAVCPRGGRGATGHHPLQYIQIILRNCNTNTKEGNSSRRDFTVLPILDTRDIKFKLATWAQRVDNVHFPQRENRTLFKWESSESESNAFLHHKRIN